MALAAHVVTALAAPARQLMQQLRDLSAQLAKAGMAPVASPDLAAAPVAARCISAGRKRVAAFTVKARHDRREREPSLQRKGFVSAGEIPPRR